MLPKEKGGAGWWAPMGDQRQPPPWRDMTCTCGAVRNNNNNKISTIKYQLPITNDAIRPKPSRPKPTRPKPTRSKPKTSISSAVRQPIATAAPAAPRRRMADPAVLWHSVPERNHRDSVPDIDPCQGLTVTSLYLTSTVHVR